MGQPLAGIELCVVRDDGSPAAAEEVGSVHIRGPNLFREYWQNPVATTAAPESAAPPLSKCRRFVNVRCDLSTLHVSFTGINRARRARTGFQAMDRRGWNGAAA